MNTWDLYAPKIEEKKDDISCTTCFVLDYVLKQELPPKPETFKISKSMVEMLVQHWNMTVDLGYTVNKVQSIKFVREVAHCGLAPAKHFVDCLYEQCQTSDGHFSLL